MKDRIYGDEGPRSNVIQKQWRYEMAVQVYDRLLVPDDIVHGSFFCRLVASRRTCIERDSSLNINSLDCTATSMWS